MKKLAITILAVLGLGASQAQAFIAEPFVSYETGDSSDLDLDVSGLGYGVRLGYTNGGFMAGAEYMGAGLKAEPSGGGGDVDADTTDMGIFIGYQLPEAFRFYLTYFLSSKADVASTPETEFEGDGGMKIGIGYAVMPSLAINLESITRSYDEVDGATSPEFDFQTMALSISFPFQ